MANAATIYESQSSLEASFTDDTFQFFAGLVYEQSGIVIGAQKKNMMFSRLVRRVRQLGLQSFEDYCAFLRSPEGEGEIVAFINAMTTNLTKFFREEHHFEFLEETVIPEIIASKGQNRRRLRIWSAACSSGEEPYSIAISLHRALPSLGDWDARILATDLDTNMVARAAEGSYPAEVLKPVPQAARNAHFMPDPHKSNRLVACASLKSLITFRPLNLLGAWPMKGPFDAVFCRNVMIYFDNPTKARLVRRLADMLKPGGWLFIGHSETLLDHQDCLALRGRTIYQRIDG